MIRPRLSSQSATCVWSTSSSCGCAQGFLSQSSATSFMTTLLPYSNSSQVWLCIVSPFSPACVAFDPEATGARWPMVLAFAWWTVCLAYWDLPSLVFDSNTPSNSLPDWSSGSESAHAPNFNWATESGLVAVIRPEAEYVSSATCLSGGTVASLRQICWRLLSYFDGTSLPAGDHRGLNC